MNIRIKRLLFEAYRRNDMCDPQERSKPLGIRWLGLGTKSAYEPVLKAGLMMFHNGKLPPKRCMGWLILTPEGEKVFKSMEKEFKKELDRLKEDFYYKNSYISQYSLAGGLTKR